VKKCKEWPAPKEPFVSQPFFGRYSSTGAPGGGTDTGTYVSPQTGTPQTTTPSTGTGTTGGQKYPPDQYASPPQQAPQTQAPPGQGNGNGNGNAGGVVAPQGGTGTG
jgi:penicillin-binding protein 1A